MSDRVIEIFHQKLQIAFPLDTDVRELWKQVKRYALEKKEYFPTEQCKYTWFLNEIVERYNMTVYEVDELNWLFEFAQRESNMQPPNG
jgi:enolase